MPTAHRSTTLLALCASALVAACATRSEDVRPLETEATDLAKLSCPMLHDEWDRVRERATRVAYSVDERFGTNIVALGLGVTIFWPALLAMRPNGPDADELARLKGRDEAVRRTMSAKACAPAAEALSPERAAALPIALGERLVYEERAAAGGPARELGLRLRALRRETLDFDIEPAPGPNALMWRQDAFGNQSERPGAGEWVHWRRLLHSDMALGTVLSGDIVGGDAGAARGRLRGQVIAMGVQNSLGRPFDAAVIELFGDVPQGEQSTRLDGVMVVDRKSGVLLRLELRSGNPDFALKRTLVRIEPAASAAASAPTATAPR
jgi:hypothetical protein